MSARTHYLNARRTLQTLLGWRVVPVINENDTTTTDEISFGDNDFLAAQVAVLLGAELLLLLTDTDGLYTANPRRGPGREARRGGRAIPTQLGGLAIGHEISPLGSGGMRSKVVAAEMATAAGIPTVIACGLEPGVLAAAWAGERTGTRFAPQAVRHSSFKLWLKYAKPSHGTLTVDAGAARALRDGGTSLLPVGIVDVAGEFDAGDAVEVREAGAAGIGKGIVNYSAPELRSVMGMKSAAGARADAAGDRRGRPPRLLRAGLSGRVRVPAARGRARRWPILARWPSPPSPSPSSAAPPRPPRASWPRSTRPPRTARCSRSPTRSRRARRRSSRPTRATSRPGRESGLSDALMDRLALDAGRIAGMARGVARDRRAARSRRRGDRRLAARRTGSTMRKVRVPLGVVAVVYEARPNVTIDAAALCLKSGNAIVLRGSSSAAHSNAVLAADRRARRSRPHGLPAGALALVAGGGREELAELGAQEGLVDLIIPRGGEGLKKALAGGRQGAGDLRGVRQLPRLRRRERRPRDGRGDHPQRQDAAPGRLQRGRDAARPRRRRGRVPAAARCARCADAGVELRGDERVRARWPATSRSARRPRRTTRRSSWR